MEDKPLTRDQEVIAQIKDKAPALMVLVLAWIKYENGRK
jgi:hypothetical protein